MRAADVPSPPRITAKQDALALLYVPRCRVAGGDGLVEAAWVLAPEAAHGAAVVLVQRWAGAREQSAACLCPDCRLEAPAEVSSLPSLYICLVCAFVAGGPVGWLAAQCCAGRRESAKPSRRRMVDDRRVLNARAGCGN